MRTQNKWLPLLISSQMKTQSIFWWQNNGLVRSNLTFCEAQQYRSNKTGEKKKRWSLWVNTGTQKKQAANSSWKGVIHCHSLIQTIQNSFPTTRCKHWQFTATVISFKLHTVQFQPITLVYSEWNGKYKPHTSLEKIRNEDKPLPASWNNKSSGVHRYFPLVWPVPLPHSAACGRQATKYPFWKNCCSKTQSTSMHTFPTNF